MTMIGTIVKLSAKLLLYTAKAIAYAGYGAWRVVAGLVGVAQAVGRTRRLLSTTLPCTSCHSRNALHGRWSCANCSGVYHGFVGSCSLCGAGAHHFDCERCGASIPLG